ncbi:LPS assembly lipoprotein LptE [Alienimonas sp. DA493]|uniref:LPS assembly lipoprotein LptE n=1 Tax=Alienimonas sp. DA493 TaxID=3373605 RepID=UPI003754735B
MTHAPPIPRRLALVGLGLAACAGFTGCGYRFGHLADPEIRTVAVPVFESVADRTGLEIQLTEAVQKEIQTRTPFRLAHEHQADTVLRGRLVGVRKRRLSQTITDDVREAEFALAVNVTWEDRRGETLNSGELAIDPGSVPVLATGEAAFEIGESRATANDQAIARLARQIVDLMEVPW